MGCATGIVKYLVFLANLLFALIGLALVVIGIMFKLNVGEVTKVLPGDFGLAPIISIIIGVIIFVTAFLGCCGAVKESPCMLTSYAIILLTIFILQVAIGVYAFMKIKNENDLNSTIRSQVQKIFSESHNGQKEAIEVRDVVQRWMQCCGVDSPDEYPPGDKPSSCCLNSPSSCPSPGHLPFTEGCARRSFEFVRDKSETIGWAAIGIAAVEIIGAVFALCLSSSVRNQYRRHMYA